MDKLPETDLTSLERILKKSEKRESIQDPSESYTYTLESGRESKMSVNSKKENEKLPGHFSRTQRIRTEQKSETNFNDGSRGSHI